MAHNRRKKKLIEPRLQLRFVTFIFLAAAASVLVQTFVLNSALTSAGSTLLRDTGFLAERVPGVLLQSAAITMLLLIPISLTIGIQRMFKIVGPLYRFRMYLSSMASGEENRRCRIRKADDLHCLEDRVNRFVEPLLAPGEEPAGRMEPAGHPEARIHVQLVAAFVCISAAAVLVNMIVVTNVLGRLALELPNDGFAFKALVPEVSLRSFENALMLTVPLTIAVGVIATAGIMRELRVLRLYFEGVIRGEKPERLRTSRSSHLHDVVEHVNDVAGLMDGRPRRADGVEPKASLRVGIAG